MSCEIETGSVIEITSSVNEPLNHVVPVLTYNHHTLHYYTPLQRRSDMVDLC